MTHVARSVSTGDRLPTTLLPRSACVAVGKILSERGIIQVKEFSAFAGLLRSSWPKHKGLRAALQKRNFLVGLPRGSPCLLRAWKLAALAALALKRPSLPAPPLQDHMLALESPGSLDSATLTRSCHQNDSRPQQGRLEGPFLQEGSPWQRFSGSRRHRANWQLQRRNSRRFLSNLLTRSLITGSLWWIAALLSLDYNL